MAPFKLRLAIDHKAAEVHVVVAGSLNSAARGARWRPHHDAFWLRSVRGSIYTEADKSEVYSLGRVANELN
jgi:hypothetical protein